MQCMMKILKTLHHNKKLVILTAAFLKINAMEQFFLQMNVSPVWHIPKNQYNEKKSLHMSISSLCFNFNGLETLLTRINEQFNIIHVTEAKLKIYLRDII